MVLDLRSGTVNVPMVCSVIAENVKDAWEESATQECNVAIELHTRREWTIFQLSTEATIASTNMETDDFY